MIDPTRFVSANFTDNFPELEEEAVAELEHLLFSRLLEQGQVAVGGEVLEFAGRTNFKLRVKRPNRSVWSIPLKQIRDSVRRILREGLQVLEQEPFVPARGSRTSTTIEGLRLLLQSIPPEEYLSRSFIGNEVEHQVYGVGKILRINSSGNVEIEFPEKCVLLKPEFFRLKMDLNR